MFGSVPGGAVVHDEESALNPQSPYAAAKAAAHLLCRSYRESYGLHVACGILFNHESSRRARSSSPTRLSIIWCRLTRGETQRAAPVGNLKAQRDWGFAPDYVEGMTLISRQKLVRGIDSGSYVYRDYVLGTGELHSVWELIDRAFALAGHDVRWNLGGEDPLSWGASFRDSGEAAVVVDPGLVRPSDPMAIAADPRRARTELGWRPRPGLDVFLREMLETRLREERSPRPSKVRAVRTMCPCACFRSSPHSHRLRRSGRGRWLVRSRPLRSVGGAVRRRHERRLAGEPVPDADQARRLTPTREDRLPAAGCDVREPRGDHRCRQRRRPHHDHDRAGWRPGGPRGRHRDHAGDAVPDALEPVVCRRR